MKILEKNINMTRGDREEVIFPFYEDLTSYKIRFVVKDGIELTSNRVIEKNTANYNGSDDEILVSEKEIKVFLQKEDTESLTGTEYYYSLTVTDADDEGIHNTIYKGLFILQYDVETPFDGLPEPNITGFRKVDLTESSDSDFWVTEDGKLVNKSLQETKDILGITALENSVSSLQESISYSFPEFYSQLV